MKKRIGQKMAVGGKRARVGRRLSGRWLRRRRSRRAVSHLPGHMKSAMKGFLFAATVSNSQPLSHKQRHRYLATLTLGWAMIGSSFIHQIVRHQLHLLTGEANGSPLYAETPA